MGNYDFDSEYKQERIKVTKRERVLAEIRTQVLLRMVAHKAKYPTFDTEGFMAWWDGLGEWSQRRHRLGNAVTLNHLRRRDERLKRFADKD